MKAIYTGWSCPAGPAELVDYLVDNADEVDYEEFAEHVDLRDAPLDETQLEMLPTDWSITWLKTRLPSGPAAWVMQHGGIEYLFVVPRVVFDCSKESQIVFENLNNCGDCYERGVGYILMGMGPGNAFLVHGRPVLRRPPWMRYGHAWIEYGLTDPMNVFEGTVHDPTTGFTGPRSLYYALGNIDPRDNLYYTQRDVRMFVLHFEHYGPWEGIDAVDLDQAMKDRQARRGIPRPERTHKFEGVDVEVYGGGEPPKRRQDMRPDIGIPRFTLDELERLPTLSVSQTDNLKVEDADRGIRVWLARTTVADGEPYNNRVSVEQYDDGLGRWVVIDEYPAIEVGAWGGGGRAPVRARDAASSITKNPLAVGAVAGAGIVAIVALLSRK